MEILITPAFAMFFTAVLLGALFIRGVTFIVVGLNISIFLPVVALDVIPTEYVSVWITAIDASVLALLAWLVIEYLNRCRHEWLYGTY